MKRKDNTQRGATQALIGSLGIGLAFLIAAVPQIANGGTPESRDQARVSSLYRIDQAIRSYHEDTGKLPSHVPEKQLGGWESSLSGGFLMDLVRDGYLTQVANDPLGDLDFHYRYCVYPKGSWGDNPEPFYVLAAAKLELPGEVAKTNGYFEYGERCWNDEFDFVLSGP